MLQELAECDSDGVGCLQVSAIELISSNKPDRYFVHLSDGITTAKAFAVSQLGKRITAGEIISGDSIELTSYTYNTDSGEGRIMLLEVGAVYRVKQEVLAPLPSFPLLLFGRCKMTSLQS